MITSESPRTDGDFAGGGRRNRRSNRVALAVIAILFLASAAAIVGGIALGPTGEPIGEAREPVNAACRATRDDLRALGAIADDIDGPGLADRIDTETELLRTMVGEFEQADAGEGDGQAALDGWIADWYRLLDARDTASARVRSGTIPDTWLPPAVSGEVEGIDGRMDEYARVQRLSACTTDVLEADNLDGIRLYHEIRE